MYSWSVGSRCAIRSGRLLNRSAAVRRPALCVSQAESLLFAAHVVLAGAVKLKPLLQMLAEKATPRAFDGGEKAPTLILSIDQGEEVFSLDRRDMDKHSEGFPTIGPRDANRLNSGVRE